MTIKFKKRLIDDVRFEAASVFDVNNDGIPDIVCGENWYEGPDFTKKHKICDVKPEGEYFNDFGDLPLDVNGDGYLDIVTGAWWEATLKWRENPQGKPVKWKVRDIDPCGWIETLRLVDLDGDGVPEVLTNTPGAPVAFYKLVMDKNGKGTGKFDKFVIHPGPSGHGIGWGDIAGNGKQDIILSKGWLEAPKNIFKDKWIYHEEFDLGGASVPIIVYDVNGDGRNDLIVGQAHDYGLFWMEHKVVNGHRVWQRHEIVPDASQFHDLQMADIDKCGQPELITGKRWRAHNDDDPGSADPVGIYYFKIKGGKFEKHNIDYGPSPQATGCGIHFAVADVNGDGWLDIVAPGKDGLYLFENLGTK